MRRVPFHWQILIALAAAFLIGGWAGETATIFGVRLIDIFGFVGQLFLKALRMLIVPLIASAIVTAVASLGSDRSFGRLGAKTLAFFLGSSLIAVLIGLALVNWIRPGQIEGGPAALGLTADPEAVHQAVGERGARDVVEVFLRMVPDNVVAAAADNADILALLVFSMLFGYFTGRIEGAPGETLKLFWKGVYEVMVRITGLVMKFAPIGIFALVARVAASIDLQQLAPLLVFFFTVLAGLAAHLFIVLPLLLWFLGRMNPLQFFRAMLPAVLTAFSTSSSAATLPVTLECVQKNAKVSGRISRFVVPLGTTVNMNGTALFECVAVIFIAQLYGLEIKFGTQLLVVTLALLTSIGVAGVPSGSLVAIVVILGALGLPAEAIGLLMVVERLLDMCRTVVNVFSDACGAAIIARTEGEIGGPAEP
jgi:proton glutamate symport protein